MKQATHSPGPWRHDDRDGTIRNASGLRIARSVAGDLGREQFWNMELLAAAPELLAACQLALDGFSERPDDSDEEAVAEFDALAAAIGAATGGWE